MPLKPAPASHVRTFAAAAATGLFILTFATPAAAAEFFAGKSIDLLIGAAPGGGYDIYARALGRHLGRHIPGNPTIVAKNMPGAGSARVGGFISAIAPKDGTAIAALMPGAIIGQLLDPKAEALFDPDQGHLPRHRQQRHPGVRVAQGLEGEDLRRCVEPEGILSAGSRRTTRPATTHSCTSVRQVRSTTW